MMFLSNFSSISFHENKIKCDIDFYNKNLHSSSIFNNCNMGYYQIVKISQKNCKNISQYHNSSFQDDQVNLYPNLKNAGNAIFTENLNL